jgi:hypothetical protein
MNRVGLVFIYVLVSMVFVYFGYTNSENAIPNIFTFSSGLFVHWFLNPQSDVARPW